MITSSQARNLLDYINGLGKDAELVINSSIQRGFSPNIVCVTNEELQKLGIPQQSLLDHLGTFYDGTDRHYDKDAGPNGVAVHVFDKRALGVYTFGTWNEKENLKRSGKDKLEIGG